MKDPFSVEGKVTIVTGGGTGIGESIAKEFAKRGAPVLIANRKAENLENVRDEIRRAGGQCELALCDVRDDAHCDAMVAHAVKHFGHLDAISNNHGASITTPSLNLSPNGWRAVVGINLDGVFFCSRAAARRFMAQKSGGSIVNISSTSRSSWIAADAPLRCVQGRRDQPDGFSRRRVGANGIRVNCIAPGPIDTEGRPLVCGRIPRSRRWWRARASLRRFGAVEEIAYPCIFVASDASSYVTGARLIVDGGQAPREAE